MRSVAELFGELRPFRRVKGDEILGDDSPVRMLVLDDDPQRVITLRERFPNAFLVWVATVPECIAQLEHPWDVIRLDHDLGNESFVDSQRTDCGMEVVRYLTQARPTHLYECLFVVHTRNEAAGVAMTNVLRNAGFDAGYHRFTWLG